MASDACAAAREGLAMSVRKHTNTTPHQGPAPRNRGAERRERPIEPRRVNRMQPPQSRKAHHSISDAAKIQNDLNRFETTTTTAYLAGDLWRSDRRNRVRSRRCTHWASTARRRSTDHLGVQRQDDTRAAKTPGQRHELRRPAARP